MRTNEIASVRADDLRANDEILLDGQVWQVVAPITLGATGMVAWEIRRHGMTRRTSFYRATMVERVGQPVVI